jgi:alpha-L-rhamnosidase
MTVGFDDSDWESAIESTAFSKENLRKISCQPVREIEKILPASIEKTDNGFIVDFGVTLSGYIEAELQAERGSEIKFYYAEEINADGTPKHNKMDDKYFYKESPFMTDKLIASGGIDTFKPSFAYHGFRYVVIDGLSEPPQSLCAYFVHQDVRRTSSFECGDEVINYIYNAGIRSTYSNMFWALTDCPTREKLGWTNDAQASVEQTLINFDIVPLYEKWFEDLKSSMREDGALPGIIPSPDWGFSCGPICDCLLFELPYRIYLYTGKAEMLVDAIPYFERYIDYLGFDKPDSWKFGTWKEVNDEGLVKYRNMQSDEEYERANGDFTKYWLNGETLVVKMVNGELKVVK